MRPLKCDDGCLFFWSIVALLVLSVAGLAIGHAVEVGEVARLVTFRDALVVLIAMGVLLVAVAVEIMLELRWFWRLGLVAAILVLTAALAIAIAR